MASLTPEEQIRRQRVENLLRLAAPVLDFVLAIGDRVSRVVGRADDHYPIRAPGEAFELHPSTSGRSSRRD
jgi:hypothetical protein